MWCDTRRHIRLWRINISFHWLFINCLLCSRECLISYHIMSRHIMSFHQMFVFTFFLSREFSISYHIIIISFYIVLYIVSLSYSILNIILYHILYHIMNHIYHIVLYYYISYHIISKLIPDIRYIPLRLAACMVPNWFSLHSIKMWS